MLVVEDSQINQRVAIGLLRKLGYECDVVSDGQRGLEALEHSAYAAVLMDCLMPGMDGYTATTLLRQRETASGRPRTPVIALIASARPEDRQRCLDVGMDDFLSKPIRSAHLAAALGRWLIPTAAIPEAGIGVTSNTQMTPASNMSETDVTGLERESHGDAEGQALAPTVALDAEALRPIWELEALGRAGLFDEMYALFQQDGTARLAELRAVPGNQDVQGLYRLAHAMKGEALAWGATDLAEACRQLEDRARVDDGPPLAGLVGVVERLFRATLTALDATRKTAA